MYDTFFWKLQSSLLAECSLSNHAELFFVLRKIRFVILTLCFGHFRHLQELQQQPGVAGANWFVASESFLVRGLKTQALGGLGSW